MKCQHCGIEEVTFHFISNIFGNKTEKHLCSSCAVKLGYDQGPAAKHDLSLEEVIMDFFGINMNRRLFSGNSVMMPTFFIPAVGIRVADSGNAAVEEEKSETNDELHLGIDADMKKRRELNILRAQMKEAADREDYEKAVVLRDKIKELECGETK